MEKIKVMVVDDSFFMRKLLRELLGSDSRIELVGEAKDGTEAVALCMQLKPDVITLDYNMPSLNGVETIRAIMNLRLDRTPAIVMISAYTSFEAQATFDCLQAGAVDFIQKPSGELSLDINILRQQILYKVHIASKAQVKKFKPSIQKSSRESSENINTPDKLLIIGASTGGPPLIEYIVSQLPKSLNMGIIIIQHMPKYFTSSFSQRLNQFSPISVKEASDGDLITTSKILIAPGNSDMTIEKINNGSNSSNNIKLTNIINDEGPHPSINTTMISAAKTFPKKIIAVILTGMGDDGSSGIKAIKEAGGYVIAQDLSTTVIDSMPKTVINLGLADQVLTPENIVKRIIELSSTPNYGN